MIVSATIWTNASSITYTCSLYRKIRCRTVFPLLHIHIHSISVWKLVVIIDITHRSRIESCICKFEPQFTRGNPPARGAGVENGFFRSVVIVYVYIIVLVNRVALHSLGGWFQSTPKFIVAFSYRTPVSIIEIATLCLYIRFTSFHLVCSTDENRGVGYGVSDGSG